MIDRNDPGWPQGRAGLASHLAGPCGAFRLGGTIVQGRAFLAPMAGVTDLGMRRAAQRFGAGLTVTEMVGSDYLARGERSSMTRMDGAGLEPNVVQIAGCDPDILAEGARIAEASGAVAIDINMGCPAKRVTGGLAGSALMRDPDHAVRLIGAAVAAVSVPVTVKMRLGWDENSLNAADLAQRAEREGISWVTVHGRTRCQFYTGEADWRAVAAVKRMVGIPVVVNGDCASPEAATAMLRQSGADAVMIGRGAVGRPWIVGQIADFLRTGKRVADPPLRDRRDAALEHYDAVLGLFGIARGVRHARKHMCAYVGHLAFAAPATASTLRHRIATSDSVEEVEGLIREAFDQALAPGEAP